VTNADPRLCSECGAARELATCSLMNGRRHCSACHVMLHGEALRVDSKAVEQCRDCPATVTWYAAVGTPYCEEHGSREMIEAGRGGMEVGW
jgi:hypothetical protein